MSKHVVRNSEINYCVITLKYEDSTLVCIHGCMESCYNY